MKELKDYELITLAQEGNNQALEILFDRYKSIYMKKLLALRNMEANELLSEAYLNFYHIVMEIVNLEKATETYSLYMSIVQQSSMLKRDLADQSYRKAKSEVTLSTLEIGNSDSDSEDYNNSIDSLYNTSIDVYKEYDTEYLAIQEEEPASVRVQQFYAKLSTIQQAILVQRQAGKNLKEIADILNCSLSKIKYHLRTAKILCKQEFGISYSWSLV